MEIDWLTFFSIIEYELGTAALAYKDEILQLFQKGWTNAQSIIAYLKKKYGL